MLDTPGATGTRACPIAHSFSGGSVPVEARQQFVTDAYRQHRDVVFAVARRMAGTEVAAEVTQEVFMRLWQHPDRFDRARGPLRAFLLMTTRTICIDLMRSRASQQIREQRDARRTRPHDSQNDDALLADETAARITAALLRLSDEDRDAIVRAYYGRMSYRAVAIDTGIAEGTIKSRIRHGLAQLRQILADIAPSPTIPLRAGDPSHRSTFP